MFLTAMNNECISLFALYKESIDFIRPKFFGYKRICKPQTFKLAARLGAIFIDRAFTPQAVLAGDPGFFPLNVVGVFYTQISTAQRTFTTAKT